jgi:hypothetical protein
VEDEEGWVSDTSDNSSSLHVRQLSRPPRAYGGKDRRRQPDAVRVLPSSPSLSAGEVHPGNMPEKEESTTFPISAGLTARQEATIISSPSSAAHATSPPSPSPSFHYRSSSPSPSNVPTRPGRTMMLRNAGVGSLRSIHSLDHPSSRDHSPTRSVHFLDDVDIPHSSVNSRSGTPRRGNSPVPHEVEENA